MTTASQAVRVPLPQGQTSQDSLTPLWKTALAVSAVVITISAIVGIAYGVNAGMICLSICSVISLIYLYNSRTVSEIQTSSTSSTTLLDSAPQRVQQTQRQLNPNRENTQTRTNRRRRNAIFPTQTETHFAETTDGRMIEYTQSITHTPTIQCFRNALEETMAGWIDIVTKNAILNRFDSQIQETYNPDSITETVQEILVARFPDLSYYNELVPFIINFMKGKYLEEMILNRRNLSDEQKNLIVEVAKRQEFNSPINEISLLQTFLSGEDIFEDLAPQRTRDASSGKTIWNVYELFINYLRFDLGDNSQPSHPITRQGQLEGSVLRRGREILGITAEQWITLTAGGTSGTERKDLFIEYIGEEHLVRINRNPELPNLRITEVTI